MSQLILLLCCSRPLTFILCTWLAGLLVGIIVAINAVWGVGSKLVSFLSEVTGDEPQVEQGGWKGGQKAE